MSFEDLEQQLRAFFARTQSSSASHPQLKKDIIARFRAKKQAPHGTLWDLLFRKKYSPLYFSMGILFLSFSAYTFNSQAAPMATITPNGAIKILRGDQTLHTHDPTELKVGDQIITPATSSALITFPNNLIATTNPASKITITGKKSLFLTQGELLSEVISDANIETIRGKIAGEKGAEFRVSISDEGISKILSEKSWIQVSDLENRTITLTEGDEILLRTNTTLAQYEDFPEDLELSRSQIRAIRSKLAISRSKLLTGVMESVKGNSNQGNKDIASAEKTYKSIAQVFYTTRNLEIARRINLNKLELDDILELLNEKVSSQTLLTEAEGIKQIFEIVKNTPLTFEVQETALPSFDRYVLLQNIFALTPQQETKAQELLMHRYVVAFLRKIQNQELRIDQITMLNERIALLPRTPEAKTFLHLASELFAPDVASILEEKIEFSF